MMMERNKITHYDGMVWFDTFRNFTTGLKRRRYETGKVTEWLRRLHWYCVFAGSFFCVTKHNWSRGDWPKLHCYGDQRGNLGFIDKCQ